MKPTTLTHTELWTVEHIVLAVLGGMILLVLLNLLARLICRTRPVVYWAWRRKRPRSLGVKRRRWPWQFALDALARAIAKLAYRPLRIQPFEGPPDVDAPAVSAALGAAMSRIASPRDSGVDAVTAPIAAEATVESIAAAVKAAPVGGELAAALVRITATLIAPGELQLRGRVLPENAGGPGLALTLATSRGRVRERLTIRADEFEPKVGSSAPAGNRADRLTRLATAGAVWTHFQILKSEWRVRKRDLQKTMNTSSWRSYALMRIGIENKERQGLNVARALFAKAVDADTHNVSAQFNLASTELKDDKLEHVRLAGMRRLEQLHRELPPLKHHDLRNLQQGRHEEWLIEHDPLCYQVCYKRIAAKLNADVALEDQREAHEARRLPPIAPSDAGDAPRPEPMPRSEGRLKRKDLVELTEHLGKLEATLAILKRPDRKRWRMAGSKRWKQRAEVLGQIEGPLLVLWAMVALRVGDRAGNRWTFEELWIDEEKPVAHPRRELLEAIRHGALTPGLAVACARGADVRRTSRTRFNLACWYSDLGSLQDSLREFELSLQCGGALARHRLCDRQLRHLKRGELLGEWDKLVERYDPLAKRAPSPLGNNHRAGAVRVIFDRLGTR